MFKRRTYLDRAAGVAANPSSPHTEGRAAREVLERARRNLARLAEVQPDDVIFTSGATESNALAVLGHVHAMREQSGKDAPGRNHLHALYLPSAHASITENMRILAEEGVTIEPLPVKDFQVDTKALARLIRKETVLVAMESVCGETGVIWNTREVADVLRKARPGASRPILHVDASQAPWTEKLTRDHFGADMLSLDASKVAPMRGVGALIAHRTIPLVPLYGGGGQERGLRPGTEVPELARTFVKHLSTVASGRERFRARAEKVREVLVSSIKETLPNVLITEGRGSGLPAGRQVPHILNISLPGRDTDYLVALLDEAGFAVATRSACETDAETGSRAVFVLTGDEEAARATLRISWDARVSRGCMRRFARALAQAVAFIDSNRLA